MKITFVIATISSVAYAHLTFSQGNVRYSDDVFSTVTKTSDITYGQNKNVNGSTEILKLDVYEPAGDTAVKRPVVIFGHGGTFIGGSKTDYDVATLCDRFAKKGYVTVSYDYRVGVGFPINQAGASKAVYRATQDAKAVVRFLRKDAYTINTFKIDTNYIFLGGSSAGAFIALHYAYLDDPAEIPSYLDTTGLGDIEGNSGNPGYSSEINAAINLCGALGDTSWMHPGDEPVCSMHGTDDQTVPYGTDWIYISFVKIMVVNGSSTVDLKSGMLGLTHSFYTWKGADHTPYASNQAYMDTTVDFIRNFLCSQNQLCVVPGFEKRDGQPTLFEVKNSATDNEIIISSASTGISFSVQLSDVIGRVTRQYPAGNKNLSVRKGDLQGGIYLLKITADDGTTQVEKVLFF